MRYYVLIGGNLDFMDVPLRDPDYEEPAVIRE